MRNFFTWCIATVLFGLCLLENEARKSAKPLQIEEKTFIQPYPALPEIAVNQDIVTQSNYRTNYLETNKDKSIPNNPDEFVSSDSISFHIESDKQKNKML